MDATNYVMLELNQPMHAYDIARLRGPSVVRAAGASRARRVVTLDGVERKLTPEMTVIADDGGAIGVAGVMGGSATEVTAETADVFLECAYFTPAGIRRTRRALGLSTEASYRFERGIDRWGGVEALRRCIEIIGATAGGELAGRPGRCGTGPEQSAAHLSPAGPGDAAPRRGAALAGAGELPGRHRRHRRLQAGGRPHCGRSPSWRPDLLREVDLIEEVARLHGYEKFPSELRPFRPGTPARRADRAGHGRGATGLARQGFFEVSPLPTGPADGPDSVRLLNPLSSADGYLRRRLLPGLVRLVEGNWAKHVADVRLFEIGTVFTAAGRGERPREERHVAAVLTGHREPPHWTGSGQERFDLWDLEGQFEAAVALAVPRRRGAG